MTIVSRRKFLAASSSLAAAAVWSSRAIGAAKQTVKLPDQPFQLGVASGDPSPDGFVIWTRLAPRPLEGGGMPAEAVYFVSPLASASAAAALMCSGVSKSGSPAPKPITSMPCACIALNLAVMASVGEGAAFLARSDMRGIGFLKFTAEARRTQSRI